MEASRVSSQTAETKVERRMGFSGTGCRRSREKETEHRVAGRRVHLALAPMLGRGSGVGRGGDFWLHASSAYFKSP